MDSNSAKLAEKLGFRAAGGEGEESVRHLKGCADCDNSKILRAASFQLAEKILGTRIDRAKIRNAAKLIRGLAQNYGNRRVARERADPERKDA